MMTNLWILCRTPSIVCFTFDILYSTVVLFKPIVKGFDDGMLLALWTCLSSDIDKTRSCICFCLHVMSDRINGPDWAGLPYWGHKQAPASGILCSLLYNIEQRTKFRRQVWVRLALIRFHYPHFHFPAFILVLWGVGRACSMNGGEEECV
jgi:hypothetical protein